MELARRGHALLSDEQIARADAVYETEKISTLDVLHDSIARAVGPVPHLRQAAGKGELNIDHS